MSIAAAVAGALMPDAHLGYGLPIGGVLALDNAVCPYAVGVDIACRMKLSIFPIWPGKLDSDKRGFIEALNRPTFFGVGVETPAGKHYDHPALYHDGWDYIDVLRENMASGKAIRQLGTSGSGNHFVEWGVLEVPYVLEGVKPGMYVALMSHSGSRGTGPAVCSTYSKIAKELHPEMAGDPLTRDLGWLDLDTQAGQDYWLAMNAMGEYARANHDCIHDAVAERLAGISCRRSDGLLLRQVQVRSSPKTRFVFVGDR